MDFMNSVLIIGSGGREHALLKAFLRSDRPLCLYAYPGNPGMEHDGCMLVDKQVHSLQDLADWALENEIDLTVVGPEAPLVDGIVDIFKENGLTIFGPNKAAAEIEGSKVFSKELMKKYHIPTAAFEAFTSKEKALTYCREKKTPVVIKVSGLAAGKGAIICDTIDKVERTLADIFEMKVFGSAGDTVIIEEKLIGEEVSVFVITDGDAYRILPTSQDHKAIGDGDTGPNTGGMGAYAPAPIATPEVMEKIETTIIKPTIDAMKSERRRYQGLLYCGLMITNDGPKVIEYNCRFGDPETQAVLPLVMCDWYDLFRSCATGKVSTKGWNVYSGYGVTVVVASNGYPGEYDKGKVIDGLDEIERSNSTIDIYHSGTKIDNNDAIVTNGGRVLAVTACAPNLQDAIDAAYDGVGSIHFEGKQFRNDIGEKGVRFLKKQ